MRIKIENVNVIFVNLTQLAHMWISISDLAENIRALWGFAKS